MAANITALRTFHTTVGAAEELSALGVPLRQVAIINTHATQALTVLVTTSQTSRADAIAKATAAVDVVADVAESFTVRAGRREVVYKSPAARYVALQVIASGAATPMDVHGSDFFD